LRLGQSTAWAPSKVFVTEGSLEVLKFKRWEIRVRRCSKWTTSEEKVGVKLEPERRASYGTFRGQGLRYRGAEWPMNKDQISIIPIFVLLKCFI
jgi:hypothetical protein